MVLKNIKKSSPTHNVIMVGFENAQILDITGPLEVFSRTSRWLVDHGYTKNLPYAVELVAASEGEFSCSSGISLVATRSYRDVSDVDTLLVSGGIGYQTVCESEALLDWIRTKATEVKRVGSICTGAFILAKAGLLENKKATTHWAYCEKLRLDGETINVETDAIYVKQGKVYTSAGVTSGMDMALAMVEEDWGKKVALAVAQELVLYLKRPGGQSQFSRQLGMQEAEDSKIAQLQVWMRENPVENLSVPTLAERMAMSERNFVRRFSDEVGTTPAKYVEQIRVEMARRCLEDTDWPIEKLAKQSGFNNAETLRRTFLRNVGVTPKEYRTRFQSAELK
ncbi:MAG: GlxA family transcriptional regulator [Gammaproteobacteria bacterium]|nr:GlxA family transcriptional regulator [Gammaproteobacteria bacterium]